MFVLTMFCIAQVVVDSGLARRFAVALKDQRKIRETARYFHSTLPETESNICGVSKGGCMRRFVMCAAALMVAWSEAVGMAQMKVTTAEEYTKAMRMTSVGVEAVVTALAAANFADAKGKLVTTREGFTALEGFWVDRKRDDAIEIVRAALAQIDEIDALLEAERPSRSDTLAKTRMVRGSCAACHLLYREGEAETGFRFKAGMVEGF